MPNLLERVFEGLGAKDALAEGFEAIVDANIAPLFKAVRSYLLQRVTGDPPAGFGRRLQELGWPPIDEAMERKIWATFIAAIAEQPAQEEERPRLAAV